MGPELVYSISVLRHAQKCDRQDSRYSSSLTRWRALCVICAALSATMAILSTPLQESRRRHSDLPSFYAFSDTADTKRSSGSRDLRPALLARCVVHASMVCSFLSEQRAGSPNVCHGHGRNSIGLELS